MARRNLGTFFKTSIQFHSIRYKLSSTVTFEPDSMSLTTYLLVGIGIDNNDEMEISDGRKN